MINRLSFVKVFKYWLKKIQEMCNPSAYFTFLSTEGTKQTNSNNSLKKTIKKRLLKLLKTPVKNNE